ncbi:hypothetical protein ACM66B_002017 [Microbotryomycetes sp. NB124-2]
MATLAPRACEAVNASVAVDDDQGRRVRPVVVTRGQQPSSAVPSRSASLVVSSRSRQQVVDSPRGPIKFAIPPRRAQEQGTSQSRTTPPTTTTGLLKRLSRQLSNSGTQLVRRVSGGKQKQQRQSRSSSPPQQRLVVPEFTLEPPVEQPQIQSVEASTSGNGAPLKRGLRVLGRSRSEAHRRVGVRVATEEERMDELVMRTELSSRHGEDASEVRSGLGSYFWSDSLGLCWDGREQVHPDLLAGQQTYSSDANFLPQPSRVVYASTLSTFPPRPPLRRLSSANTPPPLLPKLTEAQEIAAAYRDANKLPTPPQVCAVHETPCLVPVAPTNSSNDVRTFARSVASDSASSRSPSCLNMPSNINGPDSVDSSTSVESMREASPARHRKSIALAPSPLGTTRVLQRFQLVDDGPVIRSDIVACKSSRRATFDTVSDSTSLAMSATSSIEDWRDCE